MCRNGFLACNKMSDLNVSKNLDFPTDDYLHRALLLENVYGHTKKVRLFRKSIECFRTVSKNSSLRILDVGCGSGYAVTRFLGKTADHVMGIDMYPPNIDYAKEHFKHPSLHFLCMDAQTLSTAGEVFDVVVMADVLEHLEDPASILKIAVDLLAPGGRLLVTIPNGKGPFEIESAFSKVPILGSGLLKLLDLFVATLNKTVMKGVWSRIDELTPKDLPYNIDSGHVQFFSINDILRLFSEVGLEVADAANVSVFSGPFTNYLFAPSQHFCDWNVRIADRLPRSIASSWFFECQRVE